MSVFQGDRQVSVVVPLAIDKHRMFLSRIITCCRYSSCFSHPVISTGSSHLVISTGAMRSIRYPVIATAAMRSIHFTVISTGAMRSIAQWRNLINNSN